MAVLVGYTSYNRLDYTRLTLPRLLNWAAGRDVAIVVVDDASTDGSREYLADLHRDRRSFTLIEQPVRRGHAACSNLAWRRTDGDYVQLDNDVLLRRDDWLEALLAVARALPMVGVVAHNCEITLHGSYPEEIRHGVTVAQTKREFGTVAGACLLIPARTRVLCGRWNEGEPGQTFNRGLDRVYSAKVRLAKLDSFYVTGAKDVYVQCLKKGEPDDYARERMEMKYSFWRWTEPVIEAYARGERALNDVP